MGGGKVSEHKYKVGDRVIAGDGGRRGWERVAGQALTVKGYGTAGDSLFYDVEEHDGGIWEGWIVGLAADQRDDVNHPSHYTSDPSGVECIQITRHRNFNIGNAIKYIWRLGLKKSADKTEKQKTLQDIQKAIWYLEDEYKRIEDEDD